MTTNPSKFPNSAPETCAVHEVHPKTVARAIQAMPPDEQLQESSDMFKLLGNANRQRILLALDACELCVCDIAEVVGASISAVSHQLQLLRRAGMVAFRSDGKQAYYRIRDPFAVELVRKALEHGREK